MVKPPPDYAGGPTCEPGGPGVGCGMIRRFPCTLFLALMLAALPHIAGAQATRIVVDGLFQDWSTVAPAVSDPVGDAPAGQVDLGRLWLAHDETYFFLRIELGLETLIQEANQVVLYLDTDNDQSTGSHVRRPWCRVGLAVRRPHRHLAFRHRD